MAITMAEVRREGHKSYADRSPDVQAVMQRMYGNDSHYRSLSALFVDHAPGDQPGSLRIEIRQPDQVRTAAHANDMGVGTPQEIYLGEGAEAYLYSPAAHAYTAVGRPAPEPYPPLAAVPLGLIQHIDTGTTILGSMVSGAKSGLAEMYVHPSVLITCPFFTNKQVTVVGRATVVGRTAWELSGEQVPGAPVLRGLGDGWRMWVDMQTGIVLRLDYYSGGSMIGWAEMRDVATDVAAATAAGQAAVADGGLMAWSLPADARRLEYEDYNYSASNR